MPIDYSYALEKRRSWLDWERQTTILDYCAEAREIYAMNLSGTGPTYLMNARFCELVDVARRSVPDSLQFEKEWMLTRDGWLWVEKPFTVPQFEAPEYQRLWKGKLPEFSQIAAVGWHMLTPAQVEHRNRQVEKGVVTKHKEMFQQGCTQFMCYWDLGQIGGDGFSMWSYFVLNPGDEIVDRIRVFENHARYSAKCEPYCAGAYKEEPVTDILHEMRWIYTAMHLMSERLTMVRRDPACRGTRRRFERDRVKLEPEVRVVALRRMEEARQSAGVSHTVDWQWQWPVEGHWRNQYYPSEGIHRQKWIEEYVKGPEDKPFKPPQPTVYKAVR